MRAIVDSLLRVPPDAPPKVVELLRHGLTLRNPEYTKRQRLNLSTHHIPQELCLLRSRPDGWHEAPRGAGTAALLRQACTTGGEPLEFVDCRITYPRTDLPCSIHLRDYQETSVQALVGNAQGIVQAPCGAGKTVLAVAAIARLGQPALVIVHTHDLVDQWRETITAALGAPAGVLAGGAHSIAPVTVGTVQTLVGLHNLETLGRGFGLVVLDEAHHVPANTFTEVLGHLPGRHRWGLTATPDREDGLTPLLDLTIGPVVSQISHQLLVEQGHLVVPEVVPVKTGCTSHAYDHGELLHDLVDDARRNMAIVELAGRHRGSTLVLSNRVEHCQRLAELLGTLGVQAEALSSRSPKARRQQTLDRFRAGDLRVLCATSLADEGLDVERLERLILALPSRAEGRTIQRLGRLMRPFAGKARPVLYDLVDDHPIAKRQWYARRRAYRRVLGEVIGQEVKL